MNDEKDKILLIEDNSVASLLISEILAKERPAFDVECADRLDTGLRRLSEGGVAIVLVDLHLPDSNGIETVVKVRAQAPEVPIVVLTSVAVESVAIQAMEAGAQDYLLKDNLHAGTLSHAIFHSIKRMQTEVEFRASEARFRKVIERTADAILVVDRKGIVQFVNPAAEDMFGIRSEALIGAMFGFPLTGEATTDIEIIGRHGITTNAEIRAVEIEWEGETAYLTAMRDITERKGAERAARFAYDELERAHLELKEMHSQMVQHEKLASIGQLAAGVAHEMNTPLGFVASNFQTLRSYMLTIQELLETYSQLLERIETSEDSDLRKEARDIRVFQESTKLDFILEDVDVLLKDSEEGFERVTSIIQNLCDFSRVDQVRDLTEYDINKGIRSTLVLARNETKYRADVKTDLFSLPLVKCVPGQINQVFLNIIINAVQAISSQKTDEKGTISIKTRAIENGVMCEISNNGPVISEEILSKIFDPFFTTKPQGEGTGLGLSISYDIIVNKHRGDLCAESTAKNGTKFIIRLPACRDESIREAKNENQLAAETIHS